MTTVLLVRHGESQATRHGVFAGQIDIDLEERGELQAEKTARFIRKTASIPVWRRCGPRRPGCCWWRPIRMTMI